MSLWLSGVQAGDAGFPPPGSRPGRHFRLGHDRHGWVGLEGTKGEGEKPPPSPSFEVHCTFLKSGGRAEGDWPPRPPHRVGWRRGGPRLVDPRRRGEGPKPPSYRRTHASDVFATPTLPCPVLSCPVLPIPSSPVVDDGVIPPPLPWQREMRFPCMHACMHPCVRMCVQKSGARERRSHDSPPARPSPLGNDDDLARHVPIMMMLLLLQQLQLQHGDDDGGEES